MNIFFVDSDPTTSARNLNDKHVVKMIVETGQLLSNCFGLHSEIRESKFLYKRTHTYHPASIWTAASIENTNWLISHFFALNSEYSFRFRKEHSSLYKLLPAIRKFQELFPGQATPNHFLNLTGRVDFLGIPDSELATKFILTRDLNRRAPGGTFASIANYRLYYCTKKFEIGQWSEKRMPLWYKEFHENFGASESQLVRRRGKIEVPISFMEYPKHSERWGRLSTLLSEDFDLTPSFTPL